MSAEVGARLKELRKKKRLSQGDVARLAGLSQSAISLLEKGQRQPNFDTLTRLTGAFGYELSTLIDYLGLTPEAKVSSPIPDSKLTAIEMLNSRLQHPSVKLEAIWALIALLDQVIGQGQPGPSGGAE